MRAAAAILILCAGAAGRAEQIRIEVARGKRSARVEAGGRMHALAAEAAGLTLDGKPVASAQFAGPLRLDGRELPGRLEVFSERGALVAVNSVDLEQYVAAVVASEIPPGWPAEALRAQAVAARTFAVAQKIAQGPGARAHLGASVLDQVYRNAARTPQPALDAARATAGEVLTWGAAPIAAYFSASCGGRSESAEAAFHLVPGTAPYLRGGEPDGDERGWTVRVPLAEITAALRKARRMHAEVRDIAVESRTASGRAQGLAVETSAGRRPLPAVELRQLLGYSRLPSLLFEVASEDGVAVFRGRGNGHGVGLCQWGARARALAGATYRDILARYYPSAELRRMY
ncbi:MAG: SpoIID/LytB domain-containing protein [Deltaproteobacteria bacterium]|nr:MAG: SpoIID/LytB domain-containing protein [Deltaproteobacteria bacterium]